MTVEEIKELSLKLERDILNLVRAYEEESQAMVKDIGINRVDTLSGCSLLVDTPIQIDLF